MCEIGELSSDETNINSSTSDTLMQKPDFKHFNWSFH